MHLDARYLRNIICVVSKHHEVVPSLSGEAAASHTRHRREVVIANPNASDILASDAHEPGIAEIRARARLAYGIGEIELRRATSSASDHPLQHAVEHLDRFAAEQLLARRRVALMRIKQLTLQRVNLFNRVVVHFHATTGEHRIVGCVLERGEALIAKRQRARLLETRDAELVHSSEHLLAPDIE